MDDVSPGQRREALLALERAVFRSDGFRKESSGRPLVYGYVRSVAHRTQHLAICRRSLERYCRRERLQLCTVFADMGRGDDVANRPGLAGLCGVLCLPDSFAAVLVGISHLSRDERLADQLMQQVRDTGARLLLVRQGNVNEVDTARPQSARLPEWWQ